MKLIVLFLSFLIIISHNLYASGYSGPSIFVWVSIYFALVFLFPMITLFIFGAIPASKGKYLSAIITTTCVTIIPSSIYLFSIEEFHFVGCLISWSPLLLNIYYLKKLKSYVNPSQNI